MDYISKKAAQAKQNFLNGYNCAQAVFCAFGDSTGLSEQTARKLSSSFGGGMGRLREVCGAVSGMFLAAGLVFGYDDVTDPAAKKEHYARIQKLAAKFREQNGSIVCRELLGVPGAQPPQPEMRTAAYYKKRPCAELVETAARILAEEIAAAGLAPAEE